MNGCWRPWSRSHRLSALSSDQLPVSEITPCAGSDGLAAVHGLRAPAPSFARLSPVGTPARLPESTSPLFTHSFRACAVQPILAAIAVIAAYRDRCSYSWSTPSRIACQRTSGENLFVVLLIMGSTFSGVGASGKPSTPHLATVDRITNG